MSFLLREPPGLKAEQPELLVCECGVAYGVMKNSRPRTVTCWLLRSGDARLVGGVVKLPSVDTAPTLE